MGQYRSHTYEILNDVRDRLTDVCEEIYPSRPQAKQEQSDVFLVLTIPEGVEDETFVGVTYLRIELYCRTGANGVASLARMDATMQELLERFPIVTDRYRVYRPVLLLKGDDNFGFTVWLLQCRLLVVV